MRTNRSIPNCNLKVVRLKYMWQQFNNFSPQCIWSPHHATTKKKRGGGDCLKSMVKPLSSSSGGYLILCILQYIRIHHLFCGMGHNFQIHVVLFWDNHTAVFTSVIAMTNPAFPSLLFRDKSTCFQTLRITLIHVLSMGQKSEQAGAWLYKPRETPTISW